MREIQELTAYWQLHTQTFESSAQGRYILRKWYYLCPIKAVTCSNGRETITIWQHRYLFSTERSSEHSSDFCDWRVLKIVKFIHGHFYSMEISELVRTEWVSLYAMKNGQTSIWDDLMAVMLSLQDFCLNMVSIIIKHVHTNFCLNVFIIIKYILHYY